VDDLTCTYGSGPTGSGALRTALARFMNLHFHPVLPVLPERIVVSSGLSAVLELLAWTLANPGDGIMIGRPFYTAFPHDFHARAEVEAVPVAFEGTDPFSESSVAFYEQALEDWNRRPGTGRIRALIIVNPHNPLGKLPFPPPTPDGGDEKLSEALLSRRVLQPRSSGGNNEAVPETPDPLRQR
jgi:1-aminocyclopropane-1-carboxylate synthase